MNICIVARGWPSERDPQWGCFERDQALALKKLGHHVVVMSVDRRFRLYKRVYGVTKRVNDGIPHYDFFVGGIWGKVITKVSFNLYIKLTRNLFLILLKKVIKQEGMPDLIYAHYLGNSSIALAAKQKYGIPIVGLEHWSELGYENIDPRIKMWAGKVYKNLNCLLTVSSKLQKNILRQVGIESMVVHNMIGQEFAENLIETRAQQGLFRIISVGSLLPVKGYDILIEAMYMISKKLQNWELIIIGEGPERASLQESIEKYGLQNNFILVGRKNKVDIIKKLDESTMYVSSSRSENFSVSIIEALSAGLPVVATECGGIKECLNDNNGLLAPVENARELANAILSMNMNINKYDRKSISDDCRSRFSPNVIARQLTTIFEGVIQNSKQN